MKGFPVRRAQLAGSAAHEPPTWSTGTTSQLSSSAAARRSLRWRSRCDRRASCLSAVVPRAPGDAAVTEHQGTCEREPVRENASANSLKVSVEVRHEIDGILA